MNAEVLGLDALLLKHAYENFQAQQGSRSIHRNC